MKKRILLLLCLITGLPIYAQWLNAKFPYGGNVWSILKNGNTIFAITNSYLFQSDDKGNLWKPNKNLPPQHASCLVLRNNEVYAGTPNGVYKTPDNGQTWTQLGTNGLSNTNVGTLLFQNDTLIAGTASGVFFSADGGMNWITIPHPVNSNPTYRRTVAMGNSILTGIKGGVYRTTDHGKNWKRLNFNEPIPTWVDPIDLAVNVDTIYVINRADIYRSVDTGATWKKLTPVPNASPFRVQIINGVLYSCTTKGLFRSADAGTTWTALNNGLPTDQNFFEVAIDQNEFFVATAVGVFFSADSGANWIDRNDGLTLKTLSTLTSLGNKLLGTCWYVGSFMYENNLWKKVDGLKIDFGFLDVEARNSEVFALPWEDSLFVSTDNGTTWNKKDKPSSSSTSICATATKLLINGDNQIYHSGDNGTTWQKINNDLFIKHRFHIASSGSNIFLGGDSTMVYSHDDGVSWNLSSSFIPGPILTLTVNKNRVFAGTKTGIYYSDNWGINWQAANGLPPKAYIGNFAAKDSIIFAASLTNGIFASSDNGINWQTINDDLLNKRCGAVAVMDDAVYVAIEEAGMWYRKISEIPISVNEYDAIPSYTIYPNPTTGIFTLKGLPSSTLVNITDVMGKLVYSAMINHLEEQIDLSKFEKGLYFLTTVNKQGVCENKKIILQ